MITVTIVRHSDNNRSIVSFAIEGHADFAKRGYDIVCAGVSAVSVGTVNAIERIAGVELPSEMRDGWLRSDIPEQADAEACERTQLLLESMVVMLDTIAESYGNYIRIVQTIR